MIVAIALVSALLIIGLTLSDAMRRAQRRRDLLRADAATLLTQPAEPPFGATASALLSSIVAVLIAQQLALPPVTGGLWSRLTGFALAAAAFACAAHLFVQVHLLFTASGTIGESPPPDAPGQRSNRSQRVLDVGTLAFLLVTLGVTLLATLFASRDRYSFAGHVHAAALLALAVMAAFWTWLGRVWLQQLEDGLAWTTAGRLIPAARTASLLCVVFGLYAAVALRLGPRLWWSPPGAGYSGVKWVPMLGHLLLVGACVWCLRGGAVPWQRPVLLAVALLALMNAVRV